MMTDGYIDQFGGPRGKKFKKKGFLELLLGIQNLEMKEQKKIIEKEFDNWKGDLEQIDDVCVIGVRVS
jgi:serine phosphatase RsbU (regulator of sigma subunit)